MPYGDLAERTSILQQNEGRQETVHPLEHRNPSGGLRADDLKRAARVPGSVVGHHIPEPVGDSGLHPLERRVLAVSPVSCHQGVNLHSVDQKVEILLCHNQDL